MNMKIIKMGLRWNIVICIMVKITGASSYGSIYKRDSVLYSLENKYQIYSFNFYV